MKLEMKKELKKDMKKEKMNRKKWVEDQVQVTANLKMIIHHLENENMQRLIAIIIQVGELSSSNTTQEEQQVQANLKKEMKKVKLNRKKVKLNRKKVNLQWLISILIQVWELC